MRTLSVFIIASLASALSGAMAVLAFWQFSLGVAVGVAGLALAVGVSVVTWACLKYRKSLRQLLKQSELIGAIDETLGIQELDQIKQRFTHLVNEVLQTSCAEVDELQNVKKLIAKIDRRKGDVDRDGNPIDCVTQLQSILKGCEGELDAHIRQAISCGREIHRATQEIVIGSEAQSDSVEQTTSFIEQLSTRMIADCDHAERALQSSTLAQNTANSGLAQFKDLVEEMKQIRNHAAARERKLQALGQHTKEIEAIVQTIGTLSSRTDLLALNASIESVRAGEHGRGFAFVAEEVRALAEQSAQAVQDITRRIEMIQLETHQSISVASGEHDQMHEVIKRVSESLDSLQEICDAATSSADGLSEISSSSNHQLQLTREIIGSLERSSENNKKNRTRAEGANWTAKTLGQIGQQLEGSLNVFRLSGNHTRSSGNTRPETMASNSPASEAVVTARS